jgi:hypothetical protein
MNENETIGHGIQKISGIIIRKESECFQDFRFLLGATSKDVTRFFISGIHIEKTENGETIAVATDGRRLHIARYSNLDIEAGEYQMKECSRDFMILYPHDTPVQYPDWHQLIAKSSKHFSFELSPKDKGGKGFSQDLHRFITATGACIDLDFLDALRGREWEVSFDNPQKCFTFISGNRTALIMPMMTPDKIVVAEDKPETKTLEIESKPVTSKKKNKKLAKTA